MAKNTTEAAFTPEPKTPEKPSVLPSAEKINQAIRVEGDDGRQYFNFEAVHDVGLGALKKALEVGETKYGKDDSILESRRYDSKTISWEEILKDRETRKADGREGEPGITFQVVEGRSGKNGQRGQEGVIIIDANNGNPPDTESNIIVTHVKLSSTKPPRIERDKNGNPDVVSTMIMDESTAEETLNDEGKGSLARLNTAWMIGEISQEEYEEKYPRAAFGRIKNWLVNRGLSREDLSLEAQREAQWEAVPKNQSYRLSFEARKEVLEELGQAHAEKMEKYKEKVKELIEWQKEADKRLPDARKAIEALGSAVGLEDIDAILKAYGVDSRTTAEFELRRIADKGDVIAQEKLKTKEASDRAAKAEEALAEQAALTKEILKNHKELLESMKALRAELEEATRRGEELEAAASAQRELFDSMHQELIRLGKTKAEEASGE